MNNSKNNTSNNFTKTSSHDEKLYNNSTKSTQSKVTDLSSINSNPSDTNGSVFILEDSSSSFNNDKKTL